MRIPIEPIRDYPTWIDRVGEPLVVLLVAAVALGLVVRTVQWFVLPLLSG